MEKYRINFNKQSYLVTHDNYFALNRALNIMKSIVVLDSSLEFVMPSIDWCSLESSYGSYFFDEGTWDYDDYVWDEDCDTVEFFKRFHAYRNSLVEAYKSLWDNLPEDLQSLICLEGIPYGLFYDSRMELEHHYVYLADGSKKEYTRNVEDGKKDFYFKYYVALEKFVDLLDKELFL